MGTGTYGCMVAPVYLPDEAVITNMFVSLWDNDPGQSITVDLRRTDNFNGNTKSLATVNTTINSAVEGIRVLNDHTVQNPHVRYPDFSYYLTTCLPSNDLRLYSVRLYFYVESFTYLPYIGN